MRDKHAQLQALKREIFESLHCALPGTVVSYDAETQTAVIQPAVVRRAHGEDEHGDGSVVPHSRNEQNRPRSSSPCSPLPLLRDVPVFMPVSFEVNPGDACLVVFADCDIDAWFESGEAEVPPSGRIHSLSDGFAFVGFRTGRNVNENTTDG